ncbi:FliO/MopB family protein [bacterium]|nr:FliO/MopB family protein [bacterium]
MILTRFLCGLIAALLSSHLFQSAYGSTSPDSTLALGWTEPSWGQFIKLILLLAFVIALIWISMSLLRRMMGLKGGSGVKGVELSGGVPLGARKSIQFIKAGKSLYLIGVTDHHIDLISVINDPDEISSILQSRNSGSNEPFSRLLKRITGKTGSDDET